MKSNKNKFLSGCLISIIILLISFFGISYLFISKIHKSILRSLPNRSLSGKVEKAYINKPNQIIAKYKLNHDVREQSYDKMSLSDLIKPSRSFFNIIKGLTNCINDAKVKGVIIYSDGLIASNSQVEELIKIIEALKEKGKKIWVYSRKINLQTILLASSANKFYTTPTASVFINGIFAESFYYKNFLDKIGIKLDVVHVGDYKNAGESFYLDAPSKYSKSQTNSILDSLYSQIINKISTSKKIDSNKLKKSIDNIISTSDELRKLGIVDLLMYESDFIKSIKKEYSNNIYFQNWYGATKMNNTFHRLFNKKINSEDKYISVIPMYGIINEKSIIPVKKRLLKLSRNNNCRAVIMRVNSPGGSAHYSEVLWEAIIEFKKTNKPFIISMGSVAASGGYYVSAPADKIFAEESTITGSIGVFGASLKFDNILKKNGINSYKYKRGQNSDIFSVSENWSEKQKNTFNKVLNNTYTIFKNVIIKGRKNKLKKPLNEIAAGRVYTGKQAKPLGLIDEIGGINQAIAYASKISKINKTVIEDLNSPFEYLNRYGDYQFKYMNKDINNLILSLYNLFINKNEKSHLHDLYEKINIFENESIMLLSTESELFY